jgi:hypothetical protein
MGKEHQIGAAWRSTSTNEKAPFAKGKITWNGEDIPIVIWTNRWKQEGERTPDFYIEQDTSSRSGQPISNPSIAKQSKSADDIPF